LRDQLSFENPIVGFVQKPGIWSGVNVIMRDGTHSTLPLKLNGGKGYSTVYIKPEGAVVKRIVMKGDTEFGGVIFYDKNGAKILEAGHLTTLCSREFILNDKERLIGIKSSLLGKAGSSMSLRQEDLQFIIGWIE